MMRANLPDIKARLTSAINGDDAGHKAGFTLAAHAYKQGFDIFMLQATYGSHFNDFTVSKVNNMAQESKNV
ncbi:hypothetical protein [Bartonella taylorii]|uniref:hypothetical protein n=1 Tax=Bartonella taylorii TaxID=33046 RepID=UPI001ABB14A2|nr:hypothetical protein [Bartonella taylorii]